MTSKNESNKKFFFSFISIITSRILGLLRNNYDVQLFCHAKIDFFYSMVDVLLVRNGTITRMYSGFVTHGKIAVFTDYSKVDVFNIVLI